MAKRKAQLGLDIQYGGRAIPIARNMVYFDGNSHTAGGIGVGNNLEVEGGEVGEKKGNTLRIFSAVPFFGGTSPAQLVMGGANPNKVFKAQEDFKDKNRIKDDGTRYQTGGQKIYTPSKSIQRQIQETGKITIGGAPTIGGLRTRAYMYGLKQAIKYPTKVSNVIRNIGNKIKQNLVDKSFSYKPDFIPMETWKYATGRVLNQQVAGNKGSAWIRTGKIINDAINNEEKRFGGNMIYEINGNVKNGLMSARPKAQYGKDTLIRNNTKWIYDEKSGAYIPVGKTTQYKSVAGKTFKKEVGDNKWVETKEKPINNKKSIKNNEPKKLANTNNTNNITKNKITYDKEYWRNNGISLNDIEENYMTGKRRSANRHPIPEFIGEVNKGKEIVNVKTNSEPRKGITKVVTFNTTPKSQPTIQDTVNQITRDAIYKSNTPKIDLSKAKMPTFDVSQLGSKETKAIRTKLNTSSMGGGKQSNSDGRWIPQFNSITTRDWIGLGSNLVGHIASYFNNNALLSKYPMPTKPIMTQAAKLKTTYNINPELTNNREVELTNRGVVRRNTQSSNTSIAREQRIMNEARNARNQLYGQKENIETQLINQDRLNRQSVYQRNVAAYNDWLDKTFVAKNNKLMAKQQNMMNLISGIPMAVNNIIGNIESRQATNNTIKAIAAANPNVDGRLLGIGDYYTQRLGDGRVAIYDKKGKLKKYV